jgi:hypothetical protein
MSAANGDLRNKSERSIGNGHGLQQAAAALGRNAAITLEAGF